LLNRFLGVVVAGKFYILVGWIIHPTVEVLTMGRTKKSSLLFAVFFGVMFLVFMVGQVRGDVQEWRWSGYVYRGYDGYYDSNIVSYLNGGDVVLSVPVYNDVMGPSANITGVSLVFDSGYNLTLSDVVNITLYETEYFDFNFVADTDNVSHLWGHTYTIYVDFQNNAGTKYDDYLVREWDYHNPSYKFAVYSIGQKDVIDLSREFKNCKITEVNVNTTKLVLTAI